MTRGNAPPEGLSGGAFPGPFGPVVSRVVSTQAGAVPSGSDPAFYAPVDGELIPLADVTDAAFSSGVLGKGVGIRPTVGKLHSPVKGEVVMTFPTGHALGIKAANGAEILLHVGVDTVKLDGRGFVSHVANGDTVEAGDLLLDFDIPLIEQAGYDPTVVMVVTNGDQVGGVLPYAPATVAVGDGVMELKAVDRLATTTA